MPGEDGGSLESGPPTQRLIPKERNVYMRRDRGYLRRERAKHIRRRKKLSKHYWYVEHDGYLDKGKIHCSCPDCSEKTRNKGRKRQRKGNYSRSINYKHSDLKKIREIDEWDELL